MQKTSTKDENHAIARRVAIHKFAAPGSDLYPAPPFHPHERYPEYPFATLSSEPNVVYEACRNMLARLGLDREHFGSARWNPLAEFVSPGSKVLIKPNFVADKKHSSQTDPERDWLVLTTHPSVIRVMADYALIALGGTGELRIADAPQTETDFENLVARSGVGKLAQFYRDQGAPVTLHDLRQYVYDLGSRGDRVFFDRRRVDRDPKGYLDVDLGEMSMLRDFDAEQISRWIGASQDRFDLRSYHKYRRRHRYVISRSVLDADTVIFVPKLKTHKKIGVTLNFKNVVGIVGHKNCLPHYDVRDQFEGRSAWRYYLLQVLIRDIALGVGGRYGATRWASCLVSDLLATVIRRRGAGAQVPVSLFGPTRGSGNTERNDILWRVTIDLNRILLYADARGEIHDVPCRKYFSMVEGIVAGEREGPLDPSPVDAGMLLCGADPWAVDALATELMGFDHRRVPILNEILKLEDHPLTALSSFESIEALMEDESFSAAELPPSSRLQMRPSEGWQSLIADTAGYTK